jgi:quercetin dioxygenase-like cupin family protein
MVWIVHEADVDPQPLGEAAVRRPLLTRDQVADTRVLVDRISLGQSGRCALEVPARGLGWFKVLSGEAHLSCGAAGEHELSDAHVVLVPPGSRAILTSRTGAEVVYAVVPDAAALDPDFAARPPALRVIDWTREPVLDSKFDARKRIYVATPKLLGTKALKAEIIIYPKATSGSNHHHEGAEHFMYILRGSSTSYSNESPHRYRAGDLVYHPDGERHYSTTAADEDMTFIEFFVPAEYKTVWANENRVCTWVPTGKDSRGGKPVREISAHDSYSAAVKVPEDL